MNVLPGSFRYCICTECGLKPLRNRIPCPDCKIVFYCSEDCRQKHLKAHIGFCCERTGRKLPEPPKSEQKPKETAQVLPNPKATPKTEIFENGHATPLFLNRNNDRNIFELDEEVITSDDSQEGYSSMEELELTAAKTIQNGPLNSSNNLPTHQELIELDSEESEEDKEKTEEKENEENESEGESAFSERETGQQKEKVTSSSERDEELNSEGEADTKDRDILVECSSSSEDLVEGEKMEEDIENNSIKRNKMKPELLISPRTGIISPNEEVNEDAFENGGEKLFSEEEDSFEEEGEMKDNILAQQRHEPEGDKKATMEIGSDKEDQKYNQVYTTEEGELGEQQDYSSDNDPTRKRAATLEEERSPTAAKRQRTDTKEEILISSSEGEVEGIHQEDSVAAPSEE